MKSRTKFKVAKITGRKVKQVFKVASISGDVQPASGG